jgi:hypothetical protein
MDYLEEIVMIHLTKVRKCLVLPQFEIHGEGGKGVWSCPDFLAIDFVNSVAAIVEVSGAAKMSASLKDKISNPGNYWFDKLDNDLIELGITNIKQKQVWLYIRESAKVNIRDDRVKLYFIDKLGYPWNPEFYKDIPTEIK